MVFAKILISKIDAYSIRLLLGRPPFSFLGHHSHVWKWEGKVSLVEETTKQNRVSISSGKGLCHCVLIYEYSRGLLCLHNCLLRSMTKCVIVHVQKRATPCLVLFLVCAFLRCIFVFIKNVQTCPLWERSHQVNWTDCFVRVFFFFVLLSQPFLFLCILAPLTTILDHLWSRMHFKRQNKVNFTFLVTCRWGRSQTPVNLFGNTPHEWRKKRMQCPKARTGIFYQRRLAESGCLKSWVRVWN